MTIRMNELKIGQTGLVKNLNDLEPSMRHRLSELGLLKGKPVKKNMVAPTGDPSCYIICGANIALRLQVTKNVSIEIDLDNP